MNWKLFCWTRTRIKSWRRSASGVQCFFKLRLMNGRQNFFGQSRITFRNSDCITFLSDIPAEFETIGPSRNHTHCGVKLLIPGGHFNKNRTTLCCRFPPDLSHSWKRGRDRQNSRPAMCVIFFEGPITLNSAVILHLLGSST
jgi:hypothetical protein